MRPIRLELEGFTSFLHRTCLDFSDLDLFAITGPTGAGKSSLIDAICYALYGRVPRVGGEVTSCISQRADRMTVALEFGVGSQRYRVFRETRRRGAPNVRLEHLWGEGEWNPVAQGARDVSQKVTEIVGLDYEGFTRSVLLPQGQFQEFLAGEPEKRRSVLRGLLRFDVYERMQKMASERARDAKTRLEMTERELGGLAEATPENWERLKEELQQCRLDAVRLQAEAESLASGLELARNLQRAAERRSAADEAAARVHNELTKAREVVDGGAAELEGLCRQQEETEAQLAANPFDPDRLARLTAASERARELERASSEAARFATSAKRAAESLAAAEKAAEQAARREQQAASDVEAAEAARQAARRHDLAAALQSSLKPGDVCPVCGGKVEQLPAVEHEDLKAAEGRLTAARKAHATAAEQRRNAETAAARAAAERAQAEANLEAARDRVLEAERALAELVPDAAERTLTLIQAALEKQAAARRERENLGKRLAEVTTARTFLEAKLAVAQAQLDSLEQQAEAALMEMEQAEADLRAARQDVEDLAAKSDWRDVLQAAGDARAVETALRARLGAAQQQQQAAVQSIGRLEERLTRLEADIKMRARLEQERKFWADKHNVTADLNQMLGAGKFQTYVQQEALATLAAHGSRRLQELSVGRYRLKLDDRGQDFVVVDRWNDDDERSVKTLSGGETFLASLALSLAMAESLPGLAAGGRVVLDSIFLDEGFGSLDPEALDRAADALDALRGEGRLVCVVTHLPELAQRLPARVVVSKADTGSTVSVM